MARHTIEAQPRSEFGNGPSRRLRKQGLVPGVMYGTPGESLPIVLEGHALHRVLFAPDGRSSVIDLSIGGRPAQSTVLTDWQLDPIRSEILHVDFRPASDEEVATGVVERAPEHIEIITAATRIKQQYEEFLESEAEGGDVGDEAAEAESEE
jgi:large subunit ribosomal protein L25